MIRPTKFSTMDGPLGDPRIWAYPQNCKTHLLAPKLSYNPGETWTALPADGDAEWNDTHVKKTRSSEG